MTKGYIRYGENGSTDNPYAELVDLHPICS